MPQHIEDNPSRSMQNHISMVRNPAQAYNGTNLFSDGYDADMGTIVN